MTAPSRPGGSELVRRLVVPLAAMTIAFGAGWSLGAGRQDSTDWQVATVTVDGDGATAAVGGDTLELGSSVPLWIGSDGATHTAGWPACLDSLDGSSGSFAVVVDEVTIDKEQVAAVVALDCRASD